MAILQSILGGDFADAVEIAGCIRDSPNFRSKEEDPKTAATLRFFQTRRQQTWLVATSRRLYCILDDMGRVEPHINWSIGKRDLIDDKGALVIELTTKDTKKGSKKSRLIDFGPNHQNWYYSTKLFTTEQLIKQAVQDLVQTAMTPHPPAP